MGEYSDEFECEQVDGEEEGTRGLGDVLAMVGLGDKGAPLVDINGRPIEAEYDDEGKAIHDGPEPKKGMSTGAKVALGGVVIGGAALASVAALGTAAAATGVGVHYYRKKKKEDGGKSGKKDKKDKK